MNSLELINKLYKPYRITKKGASTIIESMEGKFAIKPKKDKDMRELFSYLTNRGFDSFAGLVDDSRSDIDIFEYIDDIKYPIEQKALDMIKVVASLHSKTSFNKEVREDKYKEIYDNLKGNIEYFKDAYKKKTLEIEERVFMSPSEYLFIRNYSKLSNQILFVESKLDDWYEIVKDKRETRVSIVHNNLSLDHFLKGKKEALISWGNWSYDSPILDIYNFYKKEALNIEFKTILKEYMNNFHLDAYERDLLFILMCMPKEVVSCENEFLACGEVGKVLDYVFKTEYLVGPYYSVDEEKQE